MIPSGKASRPATHLDPAQWRSLDLPNVDGHGSIRDPLYGYIEYSRFEQRLLDEPAFQRLRYVSQNGLIQLTYPSNRTARFAHSLGTMHVGGEYLLRALRSSDPGTVDSFLWQTGELVGSVLVDFVRTSPAEVARNMTASGDPFYRNQGIDFKDPRPIPPPAERLGYQLPRTFVMAALLQSVRLACVVHDIGHFPFSHATEYALEALAAVPPSDDNRRKFQDAMSQLRIRSGGLHLHEAAGLMVLKRFLLLKDADAGHERDFRALCLNLAEAIARGVETEEQEHRWGEYGAVLRSLHDLVSGDVDADRSDWVQRDAYASNFEFTFDFRRLSDSFRLVRVREQGDAAGAVDTYLFRPSITALSAVESFFLARYRIYLWMIQQKNVARTDLCLQRALYELFDLYFGSDRPGTTESRVRHVLETMRFDRLWTPFAADAIDIDSFAATDEVWLTSLFRAVLEALQKLPHDADPVKPGTGLSRLRTYLQFLVWRNKDDIVALWRGPDDYLVVAEAFRIEARRLREDDHDYASFFDLPGNKVLVGHLVGEDDKPTFMNTAFQRQLHLVDSVGSLGGSIAVVDQFERKLRTAMEFDGFAGTFLFRPAQAFAQGPKKDFALVGPESGDQPRMFRLTTLSRLVEGLPAAWSSDVHGFAFVIPAKRADHNFTDHSRRAGLLRSIGRNAARILLNPEWRPLAILLPAELAYLKSELVTLASALSMQRLAVLILLADAPATHQDVVSNLAEWRAPEGSAGTDLRNEASLSKFLAEMVVEGVFVLERGRYSLSPVGKLVAARVAEALRHAFP